jgi:hypothetical protein
MSRMVRDIFRNLVLPEATSAHGRHGTVTRCVSQEALRSPPPPPTLGFH